MPGPALGHRIREHRRPVCRQGATLYLKVYHIMVIFQKKIKAAGVRNLNFRPYCFKVVELLDDSSPQGLGHQGIGASGIDPYPAGARPGQLQGAGIFAAGITGMGEQNLASRPQAVGHPAGVGAVDGNFLIIRHPDVYQETFVASQENRRL